MIDKDTLEVIKDFSAVVPGWGLFIAFIVAILKYGPTWKSQSFSEAEAMCRALTGQVDVLQKRLSDCEDECKQQSEVSKQEIKALHEEIFGLRRQAIQEQMSLINAIVQSVDSPELKALLKSMESVQRALPREALPKDPTEPK